MRSDGFRVQREFRCRVRATTMRVTRPFVGFVIERYGLASFRSVYETGDYEQVYWKSLGTLEKEWRVSLQEN